MKDPLDELEMWHTRGMHVEVDLLNYMGDIWSSQCEVLKSACEALVLGDVKDRGTSCGGELGTCVNRGCGWVAVCHSCH